MEVSGAELTPGSWVSIFQGPQWCRWCGVEELSLAVDSQEAISPPAPVSCPLLPAAGGLSPSVCLSVLAVVPSNPLCLPTAGHRDGGEGLQ